MELDSTGLLSQEAMEDYLNSPALPPPSDVDAVFYNPSNNNELAFKAIAGCMAVELAFSLFRVYTRVVWAKKARLEDCESMYSLFSIQI